MAVNREVPPGQYLEFQLPLKKGKIRPYLTGRVLESRPFSGNQWLCRCALRDLTEQKRRLLQQVVRLEQRNRQRALTAVHRREAKSEAG